MDGLYSILDQRREKAAVQLGLDGKSALITGATRGIGLAAAKSFLAEGCSVIITGRSNAALDSARERLGDHPKLTTIVSDLLDPGAPKALSDQIGQVDILVNNAGATPTGPIEELDIEAWREGLGLKVIATADLTKHVYAGMCARGSGVIINVIGNCGERPDPEIIIGTVANSGMMNFTRALGSVSVNHGVRVLGVNPGATLTERLEYVMREKARERTGDPDTWEDLMAPLPYGRASRPDEQADMIVFAASERCSYVSGTILTVDAGIAQRGHIF